MRKLMKNIKKGYKRITKCVNGTKGVISLFLAILMVPFTTVAGVLLDAARFNSAVALFDEALCNASNSTLGTYDEFLRERFGLLAMSQDTSGLGSGYTAQDFIGETFAFYMEQNGFVLNNTFQDVEGSATGIYPLADTDVLLTQVLEYSKYTVPTKLVVEGMSIENLLDTLLKKLNVGASAINTLSAGVGMVDSMLECQTAFDTLLTEIDEYGTSKSAYDTGYTDFKNAVVAYNNMVDQRATAIANCERTLRQKKSERDTLQTAMETEKEKVQAILNQIETLKNQKDANGNPIDNSEAIAEIKESNETVLQPYYDALEAYERAQDEVDTAQDALEDTTEYYNNQVESKRSVITSTKTTYVTAIGNFANANDQLGSAISTAQSKYNAMKTSAISVGQNFANTIYESQKTSADQAVKDQEQKKKEAAANPNTTAEEMSKIESDLTTAENNKTEISNQNKLYNAVVNADTSVLDSLDTFASENYQEIFAPRYTALIELRNKVRDEYAIPSGYSRAASTEGYYQDYSIQLTRETVETMLEELATNLVESTFIAFLKAMINFLKALLSLSIWFDPELCSNIDTSLYEGQGGLPSKKVRTATQNNITSPFADQDSQKSDAYKQMMGVYSDAGSWPENEDPIEEAIQTLFNSVEAIQTEFDTEWTGLNIWTKVGNILSHFGNIFAQIGNLLLNITQMIAEAIYNKCLLSGYLSYNVPNRTTYSGKGITGASYSLPGFTTGRPAYTFYGAEAEYLIAGTNYEYLNQTAVFYWVYLIRLIFNIPFVLMNSEVGTFASEATAATAWIGGIGGPIVYGLFMLLEPIIDTILLVNSGDVPIVKTKIYLTPGGITDLIESIIGLSLDEATKASIYDETANAMGETFGKENYADSYEQAVSDFETDHGLSGDGLSDAAGKILDAFSFNYTDNIFIILMFISSEKLLDRFADIVQMEATYNAKYGSNRPYTFNLDESYTYLRASGKFEAIRFMKLADSIGMISSERVVYRGY